jgi:hypothetical protein
VLVSIFRSIKACVPVEQKLRLRKSRNLCVCIDCCSVLFRCTITFLPCLNPSHLLSIPPCLSLLLFHCLTISLSPPVSLPLLLFHPIPLPISPSPPNIHCNTIQTTQLTWKLSTTGATSLLRTQSTRPLTAPLQTCTGTVKQI